MAVPLEALQQDKTEDKTLTVDTDSRRNNDPPTASPKHEGTSSFLPPIVQTSEYVQLAKAGGHKDLLTHHPFVRDEDAKPVPYNRVDWWDHPPGIDVVVGRSKPRYYRKNFPVIEDVTPIRLPRIKPLSPEDKWNEAIWKPNPTKVTSNDKLPSIGEESVATLITLKYQKEWIESNDRRCKMASDRKKAQRQLKRQRLLEHTKKKAANHDKLQDSEALKAFKLKRFENIPSRVHSYYEGT